jgi:hypothetical protein
MDLSALRQQILLSNRSASEKAEAFLMKQRVNDLTAFEWRNLIAGIPKDVEKAIDVLKSAGTKLHLLRSTGSATGLTTSFGVTVALHATDIKAR